MSWLSSSYNFLSNSIHSTYNGVSAIVSNCIAFGKSLYNAHDNNVRMQMLQDLCHYVLFLSMKYTLKAKNKSKTACSKLKFAYYADSVRINNNVLRVKFLHDGLPYSLDVPVVRKMAITKPTFMIRHDDGTEVFADRISEVPLLVPPDKYKYKNAKYIHYDNVTGKGSDLDEVHKAYKD